MKCPGCQGAGCHRCHGKGSIPDSYKCSHCNGTGIDPKTYNFCNACQGSGNRHGSGGKP